jgi:hypothetical protein
LERSILTTKATKEHQGKTSTADYADEFGFGSDYPNVRDAVRDDLSLKARFDSMETKKTTNLIQAIDRVTGKPLGGVLVDAGKFSFRVESAGIADDTWLRASRVTGHLPILCDQESRPVKYLDIRIAISEADGRLLARYSARGAQFQCFRQKSISSIVSGSTMSLDF